MRSKAGSLKNTLQKNSGHLHFCVKIFLRTLSAKLIECKVYANLRRTPKFCQLPTEDLKLLSKMQIKFTSFAKIPKFHRLQFLTVHLSLWPWLGLGTCNSVVKCSNNFCALTLVSSTCFKPQEVIKNTVSLSDWGQLACDIFWFFQFMQYQISKLQSDQTKSSKFSDHGWTCCILAFSMFVQQLVLQMLQLWPGLRWFAEMQQLWSHPNLKGNELKSCSMLLSLHTFENT